MSAPAQPTEWYLARDGQQYGPVSETELNKIIDLGHLKADDLVWCAGFEEWQQAQSVFTDYFADTDTAATRSNDPHTTSNDTSPEPPRHDEDTASSAGHHPHRHHPTEPDFQPGMTIEMRERGDTPSAWADEQSATGGSGGRSRPKDHGGMRSAVQSRPGSPSPEARAPSTNEQGSAPHDRRHVVDLPDVETRVAEARNRTRQGHEPDAGHATSARNPESASRGRPRGSHPRATSYPGATRSANLQRPHGYGADHDDEDGLDTEPRRLSMGAVVGAILLAVGVGVASAAGWLVYTNSDAASRIYEQILGQSDDTPDETAVISAPKTPARVAPDTDQTDRTNTASVNPPANTAAPPASTPPANNGEKPEPPNALPLFQTPLWSTFQARFPSWSEKLLEKTRAMQSAGASEEEIVSVAVQAMIQLRRSSAQDILSAPPENLIAIAEAFVANLKFLREKSVAACYGFIAEGDMNKAVLPLLVNPSRAGPLPEQSIAVLRAIEAGKTRKTSYAEPQREDFDALSNSLEKRGWSRQDLEMFSDPNALSRAPHDQVCRLVTQWFETQLAMPDGDRKMRLLTASLQPVVAG